LKFHTPAFYLQLGHSRTREVKMTEKKFLKVIIVGAGIAGLSAAVALRRAGHVVHIYERSSMNNEVGAAINVPPNAIRFLVPWGLDTVKWRFVKAGKASFINPLTLHKNAVVSFEDNAERYNGAELFYAHRVDLHDALKQLATDPEGPGVPATIHLKSWVVGFVCLPAPNTNLSDIERAVIDEITESRFAIYKSLRWGEDLWRCCRWCRWCPLHCV
jgi:hypothetical protein